MLFGSRIVDGKRLSAHFVEATMSASNTAIHTANDTLARSNNNADHALKFTKLALSYVGELAKGEIVDNSVPSKARADFDGDGKKRIFPSFARIREFGI